MVNIEHVIKQQQNRMKKISIESRKKTLNVLDDIANRLEDIHNNSKQRNSTSTAVSLASNVAGLAGTLLAPTTFGLSLGLTAASSAASYLNSTTKADFDTLDKENINSYCNFAKILVDDEIKTIEKDKIELEKKINTLNEVRIGAWKARGIMKQTASAFESMNNGQTSNASNIILSSHQWINTISKGYAVLCIASDTIGLIRSLADNQKSPYAKQLKDICYKLRENVNEMESQLKKDEEEEQDEDHWFPYD